MSQNEKKKKKKPLSRELPRCTDMQYHGVHRKDSIKKDKSLLECPVNNLLCKIIIALECHFHNINLSIHNDVSFPIKCFFVFFSGFSKII